VRKGFLVGAVRLTPTLWSELSEKTQATIWTYLRTLTLESVMETGVESLDTAAMQALMNILTAERLEADPSSIFEETMNHMNPLLEKLKGLMGSDTTEGFTMPDIPERLRKGRIAKLAEDLAKQFDPAEFGIDPALLKGDNVEDIMKRLMELYQRDPTLLISGAKRMADKIKTQILGGSLHREDLIAEAQEFIEIFKSHPMFKEIVAKFSGQGGISELFESITGSMSGSSGAPSERRRAVQERLRKKMAARNNK
jgi:hypothetical protein